jgi:pyrroloquinoline-quinone synthase
VYLASLISNCGHDEALQLALAEVLFDEYGHLNPDETHPALYRRFWRPSASRRRSGRVRLPAGDRLYITAHGVSQGTRTSGSGSGRSGPASEWPVPPIYVRLGGVKEATGLPEEALEIFTSHVTMDVTHARIMMDAIAPTPGMRRARAGAGGAMRSLDARSVMLDGLYKAVSRAGPLLGVPARVGG